MHAGVQLMTSNKNSYILCGSGMIVFDLYEHYR